MSENGTRAVIAIDNTIQWIDGVEPGMFGVNRRGGEVEITGGPIGGYRRGPFWKPPVQIEQTSSFREYVVTLSDSELQDLNKARLRMNINAEAVVRS